MNMVDLIVMVCSLAAPSVCQERHMLFELHGSSTLHVGGAAIPGAVGRRSPRSAHRELSLRLAGAGGPERLRREGRLSPVSASASCVRVGG